MGLAVEIISAWRHPRRVMARLLSAGQREDRVLMFLMLGCLLIFISRWPDLARLAQLEPTPPLNARLGGALIGWLFIAPLIFYALAAVSRLVARMFGGRGSWYSARLALFWALLAASPLWLLNGLLAGFGAQPVLQNLVGAVALAAFALIWLSSLREAEFSGDGA